MEVGQKEMISMGRESDIWDCIEGCFDDKFREAQLFLDVLMAVDYRIDTLKEYEYFLHWTDVDIKDYYTWQIIQDNKYQDWEFIDLYREVYY